MYNWVSLLSLHTYMTYIHTYIHVCMNVCHVCMMFVCICMYVCMYVCMYECMHMNVVCIYECTHDIQYVCTAVFSMKLVSPSPGRVEHPSSHLYITTMYLLRYITFECMMYFITPSYLKGQPCLVSLETTVATCTNHPHVHPLRQNRAS